MRLRASSLIGIYELFPISEDARSLILKRAPSRDIRRYAIEAGIVTLPMEGRVKAGEKATAVGENLLVTPEDAQLSMAAFLYLADHPRGPASHHGIEAPA